jgi:hypothetical protein
LSIRAIKAGSIMAVLAIEENHAVTSAIDNLFLTDKTAR